MSKTVTIVKIGGSVLDDAALLESFLTDFSKLPGLKVLVHGGGKTASDLMKKLEIEPKMIEGRRITDAKSLEVVTMVYAGLLNKQVVSQLQARKINGLGLSGADLNTIISHKRVSTDVDFGLVGDIDHINVAAIEELLLDGVVPVFCAITHDGKGQLLNTNADTIASTLAIGLAENHQVKLVYCFEEDGVFKNMATKEIFDQLDPELFEEAVTAGLLTGGILPKITNSFYALEQGVESVVICRFDQLGYMESADFKGTLLNL